MADVKSYAWSVALSAVVANGESATIPTPGFETPENYQTDKAEVVRGGTVLRPEEFTVAWASDFAQADVTNATETDWLPGDALFITVAGIPFDADNVESSFDALEARVAKNEADITALDARVTALETPAAQTAPVAPAPQPAQRHVTAEVKVTRPVQHQQQATPPAPTTKPVPPKHK